MYELMKQRACATLPGIAACALAACGTGAPEQSAAELVFTNAKVYTVDTAMPWATSVAIRDGRIVGVGDEEEAARWTDARTRVVDVGGRLMLPAFGDAHAHPIMGGLSFARCSLHHDESIAAYLETIAGCVASEPGDGLIYGRGWRPGLFLPDGVPSKELLDAIAADRPLVFQSIGGHSLWVNSKALDLAGITRETPDPLNGRIDRDPVTGEPVGGLQEAAKELVMAYVPPPSARAKENALLYAQDYFVRLGVTQWMDAGIEIGADGSSSTLDAYQAVRERGELYVRVGLSLKWENDRGLEQLPALIDAAERARTFDLRADSVKFYLDGVIAQRTAAMLEPYSDSAHELGELQIPLEVFNEAIAELDSRGFQVYVHAIGDRAVRESLNALAAARARNGGTGHRHMISHLNVVQPEDQPRFAALDVAANFQPLWASLDPYMQMTAVRIGVTRMEYIYPVGSILRAGGRIAYGADWSVASGNPLEGIETALTRRAPGATEGEQLSAREGVTLEDAIEAYTLNVAWVNGLEEETGSIALGKSADLIVLDQDIFTIPVTDIARTKVLQTIFEGRLVHDDRPDS